MGIGRMLSCTTLGFLVGGPLVGAYLLKKERDKQKKENLAQNEIVKEKYTRVLNSCENEKDYFNFIIGMVALGLAMANVDGEISDLEKQELDEFVDDITESSYPQEVKDIINELYINTPNLMTAMKYISKVNPKHYDTLRDLLKTIMLADGIQHERENAFIAAFEQQILQVEYQPETIANADHIIRIK